MGSSVATFTVGVHPEAAREAAITTTRAAIGLNEAVRDRAGAIRREETGISVGLLIIKEYLAHCEPELNITQHRRGPQAHLCRTFSRRRWNSSEIRRDLSSAGMFSEMFRL